MCAGSLRQTSIGDAYRTWPELGRAKVARDITPSGEPHPRSG